MPKEIQLPLNSIGSSSDGLSIECKKCRKCENIKPLEDFYPRESQCKDCHKEYVRNYRSNNPERIKRYSRKKNWRKYGIVDFSESDYESLRDGQGGLCALCDESTKLYADHDHETGKVRGLLCNRCNLNLGIYEKLGKDPKVTAYLSFYTESSADG